MDNSSRAAAEITAQLQRDFPTLDPLIGNVVRREFGESRISVGLLSLTRSRTRPGEALPETYTQIQTAAVYSSGTLRFPSFDLFPENVAFKLAEKAAQLVLRVGNIGKVDFTSHSDFSRQYRVQALDTEGTRWLFDDRVLAQLAGRSGLSISAANGSMLLYRSGTHLSADRMEAFFKEAAEVFRVFEAAARRPSASRAAAGTPETDAELFVKQVAAATGNLSSSAAVTLADAEAFLRQPPPRAIPPAIARYGEERVPDLVIVFGVLFAMTSTMFLTIGGNKIPWYGQLPLFLMLVGGLSLLIWACAARLRIRYLLRNGHNGSARIEAIQTTVSRIDGETRHRLELQVDTGGTMHHASCFIPATMVDRLQAHAAEKRPIPVLYSASNARHVLVAESLVMPPQIG